VRYRAGQQGARQGSCWGGIRSEGTPAATASWSPWSDMPPRSRPANGTELPIRDVRFPGEYWGSLVAAGGHSSATAWSINPLPLGRAGRQAG